MVSWPIILVGPIVACAAWEAFARWRWRKRGGICCAEMKARVESKCQQHPFRSDCPDAIVVRDARGRFGISVKDGGASYIEIRHCPWCGRWVGPP